MLFLIILIGVLFVERCTIFGVSFKIYSEYINNPLLSTHFKNNQDYAKQSYNIESSGIKKEIDEMLLITHEKNTNNNLSTRI